MFTAAAMLYTLGARIVFALLVLLHFYNLGRWL